MLRPFGRLLGIGTLGWMTFDLAMVASAATPQVEQALKLAPVQADVEYTIPPTAEAQECTIKGERIGDDSAWVVRNAAGQMLRKFVDTNKDNVVDQWCYFLNGLEVYRDIDADFNGKADQYRWLSTAGTRWGLDNNQDGQIDSWKSISAEEVTAEAVRALADKDAARFRRLLLTNVELKELGLGEDKVKELSTKIAAAGGDFDKTARGQTAINVKTRWVHFGATRPGIVPAGMDGSTKDIHVYENVAAMVETNGTHGQVGIGTLVRVGDGWRLIDAPRLGEGGGELAEANFFRVQPAAANSAATTAAAPGSKTQQMLAELEAIDARLAQATAPSAQAQFNSQRADLVEQLATEAASAEDRAMWVRQLADAVSAAAQSGTFPGGVKRLETLLAKLEQDNADRQLAGYVKFRLMSAEYGLSVQAANPDFTAIQAKWLKDLEAYVTGYPDNPDAAEALMQLGMAQEFAGQEEAAKQWYGKVVSGFANSPSAKKAAGAIARLNSVGKSIRLTGKSATGATIDLAAYKDKIVLIHYWATWCEPCISDMETIHDLYAKYGNNGFVPIGVNLNSAEKELADFLKLNRLPWHHLHEPGGLEGRLANELGIMTLPTMILVGKDGRVIHRGISIVELEPELKKLTGTGLTRTPPATTNR